MIDDVTTQAERTARHVREVFGLLQIVPDVREVVFDTALSSDKAASSVEVAVATSYPHIIVCDNKMGRNEAWGQIFLAKIKQMLPQAVTCLITREKLSSLQFGLRVPNPDIVVDKNHLGGDDEGYRRYVGQRLIALLSADSNIAVEWVTSFAEVFSSFRDDRGRRANIDDVISLIEQCLFDRNMHSDPKSIQVEKLTGGRSGSAVMSCRIIGDLSYRVTGVVKVSRRADALQEIRNYNTFVKWVLPYTWKVEVLGTGITEGMGAVCYSFAFDGDGKPRSSTEMLRMGDRTITSLVCGSIFNSKNKTWYSQIRQSGRDASRYFQSSRFFSKATQIVEREDRFIDKMREHFSESFAVVNDQLVLKEFKVSRPNRLLFTEDWGEVEECVCHGDLNANNILLNPRRDGVAFIDFQSTGFHNIFRDFISFESSVRIDWGEALEGDVLEQLRSEIQLADERVCVSHGYLAEVAKVRMAAFENFPPDVRGRRESLYLIASYVHFSWLSTRFDDWTIAGYRRLLLAAFASLVVLERTVSG